MRTDDELERLQAREEAARRRNIPPVGIKADDFYNRQPSSTPGRSKGENCQASPRDKTFAKCNRSHKYPGYAAWCYKMDKKREG